MYKNAWCTCKVVVLRNKPIAFLTSSLPSPSSLLKLPSVSFAVGDSVYKPDSIPKAELYVLSQHIHRLTTIGRK